MSKTLELIKTSNLISKILLEDKDKPLDHVLRLLGDVMLVSRAYIFKFDKRQKTMSNTHEYLAPNELQTADNPQGIRSELENLQNIPLELFPDWIPSLEQNSSLIVPDLAKSDFLPDTKKTLLDQDIQALIIAPLHFEDELKGFVGFDECKSTRIWTQEEIEFLESNVENISTYMKAQAIKLALSRSEEKLSLFINSANELFIFLDDDLNIVDLNSSAQHLFFPTSRKEEIIGVNIQKLIPPPLIALIDNLQEISQSGNALSVESSEVEIYGKPHFFHINAFRMGNGIGTAITDITLRKQMEKDLLESELKYRKLFENAPVGIFLTNSKGQALQVNSEMARIVGADSPEEAIQNFQDLAQNLYADPNQRQEFINLIVQHRKVDNYVYKAKNIKGENFWLSTTANISETFPDGSFLMEGFSSDVTNQKQAEKLILEQERLSAIGEFTSSVAHDFNNTLQGIFGNIELALLEPETNPEMAEYMSTIKKLAVDAAARIRQLQRFAGKRTNPAEYSEVDMNSVIEDAIIQTRPLWKDSIEKQGHSIQLTKKLTSNAKVKGNAGELRSVLYNIIKNSIQAMPSGGEISFLTRSTSEWVSIVIIDTGIGMTEEVKARIFQPFFTTKGFGQGKGLGMSGAYGIIKEHMGRILVKETTLGIGTSIEIELPKSLQKSEVEKRAHVDTPPVRILWVDDEPMIRKTAHSLLTKLKHVVDVAESAKIALKFLESNSYDLMITDVGMPEMNGWQLISAIEGKYPTMQIAILTGWGSEMSHNQLEEKGIQYMLSKPIELDQLKNLISRIEL